MSKRFETRDAEEGPRVSFWCQADPDESRPPTLSRLASRVTRLDFTRLPSLHLPATHAAWHCYRIALRIRDARIKEVIAE